MPSATVTSKGQVTIPKSVREAALRIGPGDRVAFRLRDDGTVSIEPETASLSSLVGALNDATKVRGVTVEQMNETIRDHAARNGDE